MNALNNMEAALSPYGRSATPPSPASQLMASFAEDFRDGIDINLGVGYVNERTMPTDALSNALTHVLHHPEEHRQPLNYGGPLGSPRLIASLRKMAEQRVSPDHLDSRVIHIGASGTTSILAGLAQVMQPGIVITADPMYYIYTNTLARSGFHIVTVSEDENGIIPSSLEACIERLDLKELRFIYVVTVNNPTCSILTDARRKEIVNIAARFSNRIGRDISVIFDGAYEGLIHDETVTPLASAIPYDEHGLVYELGTLSKIFAPALRVGYAIGPEGSLMDALVQYTNDVGFSAPLLMQEVAARLIDHELEAQRARVCTGYREKARSVRQAIDEHLGPYLESVEGGRAGFYYYLTFREIETSESSPFFTHLTTADNDGPRVVYIPGCHFVRPDGPLADQGKRQLRLSYGYEETDRIIEAIALMGQAARHVVISL